MYKLENKLDYRLTMFHYISHKIQLHAQEHLSHKTML